MLDRTPVSQGWAVTGINVGTAISNMNDYVKTFAQIGNVLYMGGKFLQVQHGIGGPTFTQSYLAAFDVNTGEWIPTFNPVINAPVWKIMASPDGTKLFVGGEFTSVNGQANTTALAALDPTTGAVVPSTSWQAYASRPTGSYDIRAMSIQGPWLYLGGNFTKITGGTGFNTAGPLNVGRLARVAISNGQPDWKWTPTLDTAPMDINASAQGDRLYAVGTFTTLNGTALASPHETAVDTTTGALVPGLQPWVATSPGVTEPSNTILEVGDHVYQGGSQHYLHSYARSNYTFEKGYIAQNNGGDFQALAYKNGILYGSCHCVTDYQFQDTTNFSNPTGYTRADPINLIGAYDTTNNMSALPEFNPTQLKLKGSGGEGPWALFFDSNGCMWAGGDLVRQGASASPYYGGYEKFCDRDTTPPSTPTNVQSSITGNNVTLSWTPSTDNSTTPIQYEILKDDPTFGTIVVGTTFDRNWTDTGVTGTARYFVRAEDNTGNRSASTSVISVTPPPPAAATLVAHGDTWSYNGDGQDLGTAWRQPGFDSSAWSTGASQLGWGSKGETTTVPSAPVTDYFVKHVNIPSPSIYSTVTVRLKADDGAVVYINGVEAVRSNLPAGPLTASTPASSFVSGGAESTWNEYQVPASMFANGDNTIAVELHQATANNADGIFDLELVARTSTEANPPTTPAPSVSNVTYSAATVSWAPSTDDAAVIGYLVRRNGTPVAFTTSTSFIDSGLTPTTNYSYDVLAYDTSGNASAAGTVGTTTLGNPTIVKSGDTWSYLATNTDPGTTWRQPGFNASSWATGPSQLGWGGRGELTTVPTGTLTQYYVHHFNVADPSSIPQVTLRLKRDDGAAVYLNGIEVVRNNLPTGPLTAGTFSSTKVTAADGVTWYTFTVPGNLLVSGDNVVAAEVHQDSKSDTRGVFDLELVRSTPAETNPPTRPVVSLTGTTDNSLSISWTASTDDAGILGYVVRRDGAVIAYTTNTSLTDTGLNGNSTYGYQVVAIDTSGNASTTGSLAATTTGTTTVVKSGDTWSYLATNTDPGTAWRQPGFDASSWSSGPSQLGWGGRGELTTLPTGTLTQYFVRHVNVTDPSTLQTLALSLKRDDGAAVYINGTEVLRDNLPAGPLTAATYSSTKVTAADGVTWKQFTVPGTALVAGDNVIAAELHQDSKSDTRGVFDLELKATVVSTAPVVTLTAPANAANVSAPTTFSGLCTTSAGTVTVNVTGATPAILTAPCVANEWSTSSTLPDGGYSAVASQTAGTSTGTSSTTNFTVDSTAPVVTLDSPVTGTVLASTPTFSGTCSTTDGNVTVAITGSGAATLTTPCTAGAWSVAELSARDRRVHGRRIADRPRRQRRLGHHEHPDRRHCADHHRQHRHHRERVAHDGRDGHADADGHRCGRRRPDVLHDGRLHADHRVGAGHHHHLGVGRRVHDQVLLGGHRRQRRAGQDCGDADPGRPQPAGDDRQHGVVLELDQPERDRHAHAHRHGLRRRGDLLHDQRHDADHGIDPGHVHRPDRRGHVQHPVLLGRRQRQRRAGQDRHQPDPHRQDAADGHGQHVHDRQRLEEHPADGDAHAGRHRRVGHRGHVLHDRRIDADHGIGPGHLDRAGHGGHLHHQVLHGGCSGERGGGQDGRHADPHRHHGTDERHDVPGQRWHVQRHQVECRLHDIVPHLRYGGRHRRLRPLEREAHHPALERQPLLDRQHLVDDLDHALGHRHHHVDVLDELEQLHQRRQLHRVVVVDRRRRRSVGELGLHVPLRQHGTDDVGGGARDHEQERRHQHR